MTPLWHKYGPILPLHDPVMTPLLPQYAPLWWVCGLAVWYGAWLAVVMTVRVVGVVGWLAVSLAGWRAGRLAVLLAGWFNDGPSETTKVYWRG